MDHLPIRVLLFTKNTELELHAAKSPVLVYPHSEG